jgi:hypothetical protein
MVEEVTLGRSFASDLCQRQTCAELGPALFSIGSLVQEIIMGLISLSKIS